MLHTRGDLSSDPQHPHHGTERGGLMSLLANPLSPNSETAPVRTRLKGIKEHRARIGHCIFCCSPHMHGYTCMHHTHIHMHVRHTNIHMHHTHSHRTKFVAIYYHNRWLIKHLFRYVPVAAHWCGLSQWSSRHTRDKCCLNKLNPYSSELAIDPL